MKNAPLYILTMGSGLLLVVAYFVPQLQELGSKAEKFFVVISTIAFLVGGTSLVLHNLKTVSDQEAGWGYAAITLITFAITLGLGLLKIGCPPLIDHQDISWSGDYITEGGALWWMYQYVMLPITATMFSLLAFYVASAAYRAFRARNVEAMLLLGTAVIVLLGRTYAGVVISSFLPEGMGLSSLSEFISSVFNKAGQRAIMIGIATGVAATSLRILLGMDRTHMGADSE